MFPRDRDFSSYAPAIRELLFSNSIDPQTVDSTILSGLKSAHSFGCVDFLNQRYTFYSPLIRFQWQWVLEPDHDYELPYKDLYSLVVAVLGGFRASQLSQKDRRVGDDAHKPLEAQYQQEFYRSIHDLTHGNARITPEYGAAVGTVSGRIDFLLPKEKWGIELMRDGTALQSHVDKFKPDGPYGQWMATNDMSDFCLVDCHTDYLHNKNPGPGYLLHAVFSVDKKTVEIYDGLWKLKETYNLIHRY